MKTSDGNNYLMPENEHRCPYCPKKYQSKKDLHKHLKKIHGCDLTDEQLDSMNREITFGDLCNWNENNVKGNIHDK